MTAADRAPRRPRPTIRQAQWSFEPVDGLPYVAFQNRATNRLLAVERGAIALADRVANEADIHWELNPLAAGGRPVAAAQPLMRDPGRFRAYESALSNCRAMGGYWTGSSCRFPEARARDCGPGWIWDDFGGECIFDGGGRPVCPPWQFGTPPNCQSDMTCRGGNLRISRRGSPSCDCPPGTGIWGAFPNFTCVSAFARPGVIAPIPGFIPLRPVQTRPVATCPPGQTGTPPNCVVTPVAACPAGQIRHAAELQARTGCHMSCRSNRHAAELCHDTCCKCPAGQTGTPANCVAAAARDMPGGSNRHTAELRYAAGRDMSGWTDGDAANCVTPRPRHVRQVRPAHRRIASSGPRRMRRARRGKPERRAIASTFK